MVAAPLVFIIVVSFIAAALGAYAGGGAVLRLEKKRKLEEIESTANVTIAMLIALLGKLINLKKDQSFPASVAAEELEKKLSAPASDTPPKLEIKIDLWPENDFRLLIPHLKTFEVAAGDVQLVQLIRTLEFSLQDLSHLIRQRNALIRQMNEHQSKTGILPIDSLQVYLRLTLQIGRTVDENLFFLDRAILKTRTAAQYILPAARHTHIADVSLAEEIRIMMPAEDFIKGWIK